MPLYEEKFLSPFAIRFSQERIRPTFQDGRLVDRSMSQVEAKPWPLEGNSDYEVFLSAPFPPIEIIRWRPKIREEDGRTCVDEDGRKMLGEACWFTFDNRRLYCLQAAASKQWPRRAAAIVHIMHDLPLSKGAPRKFRTTDLGCSVRISRRHDAVPKAIWSWAQATHGGDADDQLPEGGKAARDRVDADAAKEDFSELVDVPTDMAERASQLDALEAVNLQAVQRGTITVGGSSHSGQPYRSSETHESAGYPAAARAGVDASKPAAWSNTITQVDAAGLSGPSGLNGTSAGGALTVSALAAQFAQLQSQVRSRQAEQPAARPVEKKTAPSREEPTGSVLTSAAAPPLASPMTASMLPGAGLSCDGPPLTSCSNGPLLNGGPQLLPVSGDDEDDGEDNCAQS